MRMCEYVYVFVCVCVCRGQTGVVGYEDEEMGPIESEGECCQRRASTHVAVIGTGKMARKLAALWARGGYSVVLGSRNDLRFGDLGFGVGVWDLGWDALWLVCVACVLLG
jgi:hypothetical protein